MFLEFLILRLETKHNQFQAALPLFAPVLPASMCFRGEVGFFWSNNQQQDYILRKTLSINYATGADPVSHLNLWY